MGFELDSLCDLANFGLTPALVVYFWARTLPADGDEHRRTIENVLLWPACCLYAACCVLRLARFNVAGQTYGHTHTDTPTLEGRRSRADRLTGYRQARMQPPTLSPEDSDAAASALHAPYRRLCSAEAAEA